MSQRKRRNNPYQRPDRHTRAAKAAGFTARSVFKLEEIDRRVRLLRPGHRVLDLGAAPGSWSAYAAERVGAQGVVVAVDLQELSQALPNHCTVLCGDVNDEALLAGPMGQRGPYDVVLSDMAPNTTGDKSTDQIRSFALFERAFELAQRLSAPKARFVAKIFMSGAFSQAREAIRTHYDQVRTMRPEAVRSASYEIYLVGMGWRGPSEPPDED